MGELKTSPVRSTFSNITRVSLAPLVQQLASAAVKHPDAVALLAEDGNKLSYSHWYRRSAAIARGLAGRGVRAGDRVALLFDNAGWLEFAASYLAVHMAGAVAVPLGTRFTDDELARICGHSEPSLLISSTQLRRAGLTVPAVTPDDLCRGGEGRPDVPVDVDLGDLAEIIYTSGTTGTPKGVACSHASVVYAGDPGGDNPPTAPVFLHAFPIGTNAGQELVRLPLRRPGFGSLAMASFDPGRMVQLVERHRVTHLQLVPAMALLLVDHRNLAGHDLSSVRRVILSSAPTPASLLTRLAEAFPQAVLCNAYSLTESGPARTVMVHSERRPGSAGQPVGNTEVRITDEGGQPVAAGTPGEIWLRRPGAPPRWYYRDPQATAGAFVDGWLRTGDLGFLDVEGFLYLTDRHKDLIITGGLNVSPAEVEEVLASHPGVREVAVVGIDHPVLGQDVAAAIVVRDAAVDVRELQRFVRARLAEHKTPHVVSFVDELPRNPSGKVLKARLAEWISHDLAERAERPADIRGRLDPTQARVAAVWHEVLGVETPGAHDDFFAAGGHSLAATQVAARLADAFDVEVSVEEVFDHPTVAELANLVEARRQS